MVTSRILAKGLLWVLVYRLSTSKAKSLTLSTVIRFRSNFSSGKKRSITTRKTQSKVNAVTLQIRTQDLEWISNKKGELGASAEFNIEVTFTQQQFGRLALSAVLAFHMCRGSGAIGVVHCGR